MKYWICLFIGIFFIPNISTSQEIWTLSKCIEYAQAENLNVRNQIIETDISRISRDRSLESRLPNLNASATYNLSFGRNLDLVTYDFVNKTLRNNSNSFSSNLTLFNGGKISNNILQTGVNHKLNEISLHQLKLGIALQVAQEFLGVLFASENVESARRLLDISQQQLDQAEKQIRAGVLPEADRFDFISQVARENQNIIGLENQLKNAYLNLKNLMGIPPDSELNISAPSIGIPEDANPEVYSLQHVIKTFSNVSKVKEQEDLRVEFAALDLKIATADQYPSLSIGGSANSFSSSLSRKFTDIQTVKIPSSGIFINDQPVKFEVEQSLPLKVEDNPYFTQLNENLGFGLGFSLNIPLYNRSIVRTNIDHAKLRVKQAENNIELERQNLASGVQAILNDATAAKKAYEASQVTFEALENAFLNTSRKFELGAATNYEVIIAKNRYDNGANDMLVAKYDYLLKLKILDLYLGREITID